MRINFITGHAVKQKRKTGFHFWSDFLSAQGHDVRWITAGQSLLSSLKKGRAGSLPPGPYNKWIDIKPGVRSLVFCPIFHPINLGKWNSNFSFVFDFYPKQMPNALIEMVKGGDVFIVESGAGLMLVPHLKKICPKAKFIYFASDRMSTLDAHPAVKSAEKKALSDIDMVRVVSETCLSDFADHPKVRYIPQGIDKVAFEKETTTPYTSVKNIICAGDMLFDAEVVETMADLFPEATFHLFGKNATARTKKSNIIEYGEYPFDELIPYLQHADIGLAPYRPAQDANYFAQSGLKIAQYTYCRLPVVLPDTITDCPPHLIRYNRDNKDSIQQAIAHAFSYDRSTIDKEHIPGWNEVILRILVEAGAMSP